MNKAGLMMPTIATFKSSRSSSKLTPLGTKNGRGVLAVVSQALVEQGTRQDVVAVSFARIWVDVEAVEVAAGDGKPQPVPRGQNKGDVAQVWRNIIGGAASCRFHRPATGLGLSPLA